MNNMASKFNRVLLLPWRSVVAENARTAWSECRRCFTCLSLTGKQNQPKHCESSHKMHLVKKSGYMLTFTRNKQSLSSDFGAHSPSVKQMEHFLFSRKILFEHGHTSLIASCPFCASEKEDGMEKPTTLSLYINKTTGSHFCKNCGTSGTWQKFKVFFQSNGWCCLHAVIECYDSTSMGFGIHLRQCSWVSHKMSSQGNSHAQESRLTLPEKQPEISSDQIHVNQIWESSTPLNKCFEDVWEEFVTQFKVKELRKDILEKFEVRFTEREFKDPTGRTEKHNCVVFPWYDVNKSAVKGVKLVKLGATSPHSSFTIEPRQGFLGLFGWNTVDPAAKEVVLTSTEFDAMAVNQSTLYAAISLPLGTNSLPPEVLPQLEQFEKIILWFGNDVFSRQAANQFSRKLNLNRCFLVRPTGNNSPSSALDALTSGCDLTSLVSAAQPISHEKITTFHQLRGEVYNQFVNADQVAGVKWTRFPKLNGILKGLRRGEVTVFTGPTGAGKTTLLSEMSLDLCMQGVNTLWGSFEIRNVRLVKMMLCQYSGMNLEKDVEQFQYWADKFEMLPMYFMCFYGAQNINTVIETMSHAAYVYDIEHVIVDNLQFMTSYLSRSGEDRFSAQNHVIAALRNFASTKNVHVTLVIHPRKENEDVELQTASIFGSAKASQEADNVIILQNKKGTAQKYLQVTKNRFDGVLGRVPLDFVRESLSMSGFGKVLQPNKSFSVEKRRPEKLRATRLAADVDVVKFSAPKMIGSNRTVNKNTAIPQPFLNRQRLGDRTNNENEVSNPVTAQQGVKTEEDRELDNAEVAQNSVDKMSNEKKENVQRTVKRILSGTRLITKAVSTPRNSYSRANGLADKEQNTS